MLTGGSLFSGIGGFDLGFERAGIIVKWQVENDPLCCGILRHHWPKVKRYGDIKKINWEKVAPVDVLFGGFPCQPASVSGRRLGEADERWLWPEFERAIRALNPKYVAVENVPGLLFRGFDSVLASLAQCGFDAEWQVLPAYAVGSPQTRKRILIVAYPACQRLHPLQIFTRTSLDSFNAAAPARQWGDTFRRGSSGRIWNTPDAGTFRMVDGFSDGLDRLHAIGNAIVPRVAEYMGRCIVEHWRAISMERGCER